MGRDKNTGERSISLPAIVGNDSYNNGAGMTRVITAAQFIKGNMPYGTTFDKPILTDDEAYDVAGYINQKIRPAKPNREVDFPDLTKSPYLLRMAPMLTLLPRNSISWDRSSPL